LTSGKPTVEGASESSGKVKKVQWNDTRGLSIAEKKAAKAVPDAARAAIAIDEELFQWTGSSIDHEYLGDWDWSLEPKESRDVLELLSQTSRLTWREVKELRTYSNNNSGPLHHSQPVSSIAPEAQKRLDALGRGDQESVFRLRHGNLFRVWGVLDGSVMHVLWFDRGHKICPTE
jgi:hypothetical protein